jgi:hypothetical protein
MGSMVKEITKKYLFRLENINLFKFIQLLMSLVPLKIMTSGNCLGDFVYQIIYAGTISSKS